MKKQVKDGLECLGGTLTIRPFVRRCSMAAKEATAEDDLPSDYAVGDLELRKLEQTGKPKAPKKRFFQKDRRQSSRSSNEPEGRSSPRYPRRRSTMGATENENLEEEWKESNYVELWQGAGLDQPNEIHRRHSISELPANSSQAKRTFSKRHSVDGGKVDLGKSELAVVNSSLTITKAAAVSDDKARKKRSNPQQRRFSLSGSKPSGFFWGLGKRATNKSRRRHSTGFTSWADAHAAEEEQSVQISSVDSSITGIEKFKGKEGPTGSVGLPPVSPPEGQTATRDHTSRRHSVDNAGNVLHTHKSEEAEETKGKQLRRHTVDNSGPDDEQAFPQSQENVWSPVSWGKLSLSQVMAKYAASKQGQETLATPMAPLLGSPSYSVLDKKADGRASLGRTEQTSNRSLALNDIEKMISYEAFMGYNASFDQDLTNSGLLDLDSDDEEEENEKSSLNFYRSRVVERRQSLGPSVAVSQEKKHSKKKRRHSTGESIDLQMDNITMLALSLLAPLSTVNNVTNQTISRRHSMAGPTPDRLDAFFFCPPKGDTTTEQYHFFEGSFNSGRLVSRRHSTVGCMKPASNVDPPRVEEASVQLSSVASPITTPSGLRESSSSDLGTDDSPSTNPRLSPLGSQESKAGVLETVFEPRILVSGKQSVDHSHPQKEEAGLSVSSWGKQELSISGLLAEYTPSNGTSPVSRPSSGRKTSDSSIALFLQDTTPQDGLVNLYSDDSSRGSSGRRDSLEDHESSWHSSDSTVRTRPSSTNHESDSGEDGEEDDNDMYKLSSLEDMLQIPLSVDLSTVKACAQVLDSNHSSRVIFAAIEKLHALLSTSKEAVWSFVGTYGGVSLLTTTMSKHENSSSVQMQGVSLLSEVVQKHSRFATVILRSGAVAIVSESMKRLPRSKELQVICVTFLMSLYDTLDENELKCDLLSTIARPILKSIQVHARDEVLSNLLGMAVWKLSETSSGREVLVDNDATAVVSWAIVHGCDELKVGFMTLFQNLVKDHARGHPCYSDTGIECPFETK